MYFVLLGFPGNIHIVRELNKLGVYTKQPAEGMKQQQKGENCQRIHANWPLYIFAVDFRWGVRPLGCVSA